MTTRSFLHKIRTLLGTTSVALTLCLGMQSGTAHADNNAASDSGVLEEVVVTAQKREQRLQDVGVSVTALSTADLQNLGIKNETDLVEHVPSLQFNAFSPSVTVFNIRGISQNDYADHYEPPVAIYEDDSYAASMAGGSIPVFDMQRVEVLRGPQGTLFGRNATGGLVQFISNKPSTDWEGYVQATYGSFNTHDFEAAIGGPINDRLQFRVAGLGEYSSGYIMDATSLNHGNNNHYSLRMELAWQPTDSIDTLLIVRDTRNNHEVQASMYTWNAAYPDAQGLGEFIGANQNPWHTCNGCDAIGYKSPYAYPSPWQVSTNFPNDFNRTMVDASFKIDWNMGAVDLVSVSDGQNIEKNYIENCGSAPLIECIFPAWQHLTQYSEEVRLSNAKASANQWVVGAYYLNVNSHDSAAIDTPYFDAYASDVYQVTTKSWALFGQDEYAFAEHWSGIAGIRYWSDRKNMDYSADFATTPDTIGTVSSFNPTINPGIADPTFHDVSGKLEVDYKPSKDFLSYLSWNRGTKSGGFSAPQYFPPNPDTLKYNNEVLDSYELGIKATALNGTLRADGAAFYYDYHNYQAFSYIDLVALINNRQASERGAELEVDWAPNAHWYTHVGATTLNSTVKGVQLPDGEIVDRSLPQAPSFSGNLLERFSWKLFSGTAALQYDLSYNGPLWFTVLEAPVDKEPGRTVSNVRASWTSADDRWTTSLSVSNLTEKVYRIYSLDISSIGLANSRYAPPRWVLFTVRYNLFRRT